MTINNYSSYSKSIQSTNVNSSEMKSRGFIIPKNKKLMLINKRNKVIKMELPVGINNARMFSVDKTSKEDDSLQSNISGNMITLNPFAVTVINLED